MPSRLVAILALAMAGAIAAEPPAPEPEGTSAAELAERFRPHCVKVFLHLGSHGGEYPEPGPHDPAEDIRNERPTLLGGYWWDERRIIVEDPIIADRFIRSVEIGAPGSDRRYPARLAGCFLKLPAILLEALPDSAGDLPESVPLRFADESDGEVFSLAYAWRLDKWLIDIEPPPAASSVDEAGGERLGKPGGVLFSGDGLALGLAFGDQLSLDDDHWLGRKTRASPFLGHAEKAGADARLGSLLERMVLKASFRLRHQVEEDEDDPAWLFEESLSSPTETAAAGLVVGRRHLLVPLTLPPERVANIEAIHVVGSDGRETEAGFVGSFRDYLAVLIETDEYLLDAEPPPEFSSLNPLAAAPAIGNRPEFGYFFRRHIDYESGWRNEIADHDRRLGLLRGYRDDPVIRTFGSERNGALAFDSDLRLAALALTPRPPPSSGDARGKIPDAGFLPLGFLAEKLRRPGFFAPAIAPAEEEAGKRPIDFGAEYQSLDVNLSRLFSVQAETRGGSVGLLVTHVYPGFPAAELGLREHDIMLRLRMDGVKEPVELEDGDANAEPYSEFDFAADPSRETFAPPPPPSRNNALSALLTAAGVGRRFELEYLREGETRRASFVSSYGEPDFRHAKPERFSGMGLEAKPVTYETARHLRRPDRSGAVISRVRDGSRAEIAGLRKHFLITHVNGAKVANLADLAAKTRNFEDGGGKAVELTVECFGVTRLVRLLN